MGIIVIVLILMFVGTLIGYIVGKYDGRYEERSRVVIILKQLSWNNSTPVERCHVIAVKGKLIEALREEWSR